MNKARLITGLALAVFALLVIFVFGHLWFMIITVVAMSFAGIEFCALAGLKSKRSKALYVGGLWFLLWLGSLFSTQAIYLGTCFSLLTVVLILLPLKKTAFLKKPTVVLMCGYLLMVPAWQAFNLIHLLDKAYLLFFLLLVTLSDTGAYYVGSLWGKHRLAPSLSPKKTIEGLIGGIVVSLLVANVYRYLVLGSLHADWLHWSVLSIGTILFGVVGDLFESLLKRHVNIKDSGTLLPGHGGVFDRLDSLLIAIPFFTLFSMSMALL